MALELFTPTGPVTEMPLQAEGPTIIAIRVADFVGPARGTLSVVADSLSVAGNVVLDTQTIPVQTTNTSIGTQFGLAGVDDSVRVPIADMGLFPDIRYVVYASSRQEGDPPADAHSRLTTLTYGNQTNGTGTAGFWGWGVQTASGSGFRGNPFFIARPIIPNYIIYDLGLWTRATETYLKLRAWGIAGGSQSTRFDMIYLVPSEEVLFSGSEWTFEDFVMSRSGLETPLRYDTDGTLLQDRDNDATSVPWLGRKVSVLRLGAPWTPENTGVADFQESDSESSAVDVNGFEWDFVGSEPWAIVDPKSSLAYIAGTTHVTAHPIVSETFPSFVRRKPSTPLVGNWSFTIPGIWHYHSSEDYVVAGEHGSTSGDGGETFLPHYWTPLTTGVIQYNTDPTFGEPTDTRHGINWGHLELLSGHFTDSASDPQTHHPMIRFRSAIIAAKFSIEELLESHVAVGTTKLGTGASNVVGQLVLSGTGDLTLSLVANRGSLFVDEVLSGPVSLGSYTLTDQWWIKIEKRLYHYRAKAWEDGTTEPDWQIEGIEPLWAQSPPDVVPYPWDDNWVGDVNHDSIITDPADTHTTTNQWYVPLVQGGVAAHSAGVFQLINLHHLEAEYDPYPGTLGTVTTKTVKYDGSAVLDAPVDVPYGSHRWVYEPSEVNRHFTATGFGGNTFDIRAWKGSGFPILTPAIVGHVWERRSHRRRFVPQIYRRSFG